MHEPETPAIPKHPATASHHAPRALQASVHELPHELHAAALAAHPDYRVVRRLRERDAYGVPDGRLLHKGVVIDTETTGLAHDDKMIELAMIAFEFDPATGQVFRVLDTFGAFEDPGVPIPAGSTAVHGITDAMVAGQRIDDAAAEAFLQDCTVVVAHNARFDRPFVETRLPCFVGHAWGCSFAQVDWDAGGVSSAKLEFIAYRMGFFFEAHRALADCRALLEILQGPLPVGGGRPLAQVLAAAARSSHRVWARSAAFATRDLLKARGYRWAVGERCWHREVDDTTLPAELAWLKAAVYGGRGAAVEIDQVDACVRFSARTGVRHTRQL